ncbi:ATP-dependent RNA helicase DeaD [Methanomicrobium sp. W14]|uniref:DEAD/DEAH box helicase n=1 Tax=Methanomicrobium sp. W14 TaxID=2817839 RepID=UPI001AE324F4|nr:DEAD/DEAH box helicase [Methanomicrobium sp. W14]MBP2133878.1 ATP-dependent RNA helicase DeaD [Methanomicrobium sp. W14]
MDTFLKFSELNISKEILKAIEDMGFEEPTPIQQLSIPLIMQGRDVTGQAQTGTGKTASFAIPVIEKLDTKSCSVQTIVLSPTRELTIQIAEEFNRLLKYRDDVRVLPIYGGQPIERQISVLKRGVHVVVGTPGRVMDHLRRGTLNLSSVSIVVIDEADQMLDMGFKEDLEAILEYAPKERQTILFSATMPRPILKISKAFQKNPEFLKLNPKELTVPLIEQSYIEVRERDKLDVLCRLIDISGQGLSMIFCNTKKRVDELSSSLHSRGYFAEGLHGDMKQSLRDRVMGKFRNGSIDILIATDVAARGIDVEDIDTVYNYDVPQDVEYYVHRIGRTGRAGKTGRAYTFVGPRETEKLRMIQRLARVKIRRVSPPSTRDVENCRIERFLDKVRNVMTESDLSAYTPHVERLMDEDFTLTDISAALIKLHMEDNSHELPSGHKEEQSVDFLNTGGEPGMVRFFINIGKSKGIRPGDIVGAIAGEAKIQGSLIGAINILNDFSFVEVPEKYAPEVHRAMNNATIRGNEISFEPARKAIR